MIDKRDRVAGMIKECAAEYIARESNYQTMITPTRVGLGIDSKRATIFVSVFPTGEERGVLQFLSRHRSPFRDYLKKRARLRVVPFIDFALEGGE
jgi:ribosome-binding factor A